MPDLEDLAEVLSLRLPADKSSITVTRGGDDLPSIMIIHAQLGLICVEVGRDLEALMSVRARLNIKVDNLKESVSSFEKLPLWRISIVESQEAPYQTIGKSSLAIRLSALNSADWPSILHQVKCSGAALKAVRDQLQPAFVFKVTRWTGSDDANLPNRREVQIRLDKQQAQIAATSVDDVALIAGPPGSGKTLVLLARARLLGCQHSDWRVVFIVYTKNLAASLRDKAIDLPSNVQILTLKEFLDEQNLKRFAKLIFAKGDEDNDEVLKRAEREYKLIKYHGIEPSVDALLVDEWQDFPAPFLEFLLATVRKQKGGAVLAGDERQSIFLDKPAKESLKGKKIKLLSLKHSYRSTREILAVAQALDESAPRLEVSQLLSGDPVSLVSCANWREQAAAIAKEIVSLLARGRSPGEIAVLTTTRSGANHVSLALEEEGISFVNLTQYWDNPIRSRSKVSVMTVHAAKGDEFQVVLVHGRKVGSTCRGTGDCH